LKSGRHCDIIRPSPLPMTGKLLGHTPVQMTARGMRVLRSDAKEWSADYDPHTFDELPIKYALDRIANRLG
jgi:hypothetical protein